jgi:hypothetical protein
MEEKLKGYTEEEFQSLLALMGLGSLLKTMKGWGGDTPEDRFLIIETYRRAIADGEKMTGYTSIRRLHERMVGNTRSVNGKY